MASWHNNFACPPPPNFPESENQNSQLFPPLQGALSHPPPQFACTTQSSFGVPPPPMLPPMVPTPFPQFMSPSISHTVLPPPQIMSTIPQNLPKFTRPPVAQATSSMDLDEKFEHFKTLLEGHYKGMNKIKKSSISMKVSDIKDNIVKCFEHIEQLESLTNCLQLTYKSLPDNDWRGYCTDAEKIKGELTLLMNEIDDPGVLEKMRKVVQVRKKKREYKKRKQKERQEQKRVAKIHAEQENRRIDLWLEKMKDQLSNAKREEDIKREADIVLSDVLSKKAEAKRMLNVLNSLVKLRAARAHNLPSGKSDLQYDNKAFNEIIDRLKKMWLDELNGYKIEEEGLKVMLGHAEEKRVSTEAAQFQKNLKSWSKCIFGPSSSSLQPLSIEELISTRQDWDKFICSEDTPMASSIPIGWVLPCEPFSKEWEKLL